MTPILAILVSTLTLAAGHNVSHGQCNLDGLCLGDLVNETRFDFETEAEKRIACISFCRKTPECFWYSLAPYEGLCLALRDCPTLDKSTTKPFSFYSGNKDCSKYTCNEPSLCQGTVIDVLETSHTNFCQRKCQDNPECLWYTSFPQDEACIHLASDCSDTLLPCSNCISGQRQCSVEPTSWNKLIIGREHFELIDLSNSSKPNYPLPDYPMPNHYVPGGQT
jgi:hypothetical protein